MGNLKQRAILATSSFAAIVLAWTAGCFDLKKSTLEHESGANAPFLQFSFASYIASPSMVTTAGSTQLPDDAFLVVGTFEDSCSIKSPKGQTYTLNAKGGTDIFVAKYSNTGTPMWVIGAGGSGDDRVMHVHALSDGTFFITGSFEGEATWGEGNPNETTLTASAGRDFFLAEFNSNGSLAYATSLTGTGDEEGYAVYGREDQSAFVVGSFSQNLQSQHLPQGSIQSQGNIDTFVGLFSADGTPKWLNQIGGPKDVIPTVGRVLVQGFFVAGIFQDELTFYAANHEDGLLVTAVGEQNEIYSALWRETGELIGDPNVIGGQGNEQLGAFILDTNGYTFYASGSFDQNITLGLGESIETTLTSKGQQDAFLSSYNFNAEHQWTRHFGSPGFDNSTAVAPMGSNKVIALILGPHQENIKFNIGESWEPSLPSEAGSHLFVALYQNNGTIEAVQHLETTNIVLCNDMIVLKDQSVLLTGTYTERGSIESVELASTQGTNVFIVRYLFSP